MLHLGYRMITKSEYELLDESVVPEIQRKPLTGVILQILMFTGAYEKSETVHTERTRKTKYQTPSEVLGKCLDPPKMALLENAYTELISLGAIRPIHDTVEVGSVNDKPIVEQYELQESYLVTKIGRFLSLMQIELKLSFLILLGYCLGVLPECIITVAVLSRSVPVLAFSYLKILTAKALFAFSNQSESDIIAAIHAFNRFKAVSLLKKDGILRQREFVETLQIEMISGKSVMEIDSLVAQICHTLFKHYGIFIENLTPKSATSHKRNTKKISYLPQSLSEEKIMIIKALISSLYYDQAVVGELEKTHTNIPKEIVCSLKLRKQKLAVDKDSQKNWNETLSELLRFFDGGILNCKSLTVSPNKISLSYPIPHSDEGLLLPYPPNCRQDPLFPVKLLARTVRGSAQEKGKDVQITLSQAKQSIVCLRDDSDVYGVFRTFPKDLIKSHVLKFLSVEAKPYQRKANFLHPQMSSTDKVIISRDSVAFPWMDLQHKKKILIPSSISLKEMGIVIEKNTILPPIQGFYEMSLLLFVPLIYPQKFYTYAPKVEDLENAFEIRVGNFTQNMMISAISNEFSSLSEDDKTRAILLQDSHNSNVFLIPHENHLQFQLQHIRSEINQKITEFFSCEETHNIDAFHATFQTSILQLLSYSPNFIIHQCGYNHKIAKILNIESTTGESIQDNDEENTICGTTILRMSEIAKISDKTLKMIADRCMVSPTDSSIDIIRRGRSTIELKYALQHQFTQAKYLLLREINNVHSVFAHPKQAFVMFEASKSKVAKLLSSKIFFCKYDDFTGKNRDFFTINVINFTSNHHTKVITIDEPKEHQKTMKMLKSELVSEKLTNGGFLVERFAIRHIYSAFKTAQPSLDQNKNFTTINAYFGKQVFYSSRLGSIKIGQSQKSLTLNDFRNMKIGNENDLKAMFLPYVDYCSHPKWNLTKAFVESLTDASKKVSFFSDPPLFQPLLSQVKPKLGSQGEFISMSIVDILTKSRYCLRFTINREMVFTENEIYMYKCKLEKVKPPENKLLYLSCVSPNVVESNDTEESVKNKNLNSVDVRFSKILQNVDESVDRTSLRPEILQFADNIWYDDDNYTLYYLYEDKERKAYSAIDLVELNLAFGSTIPDAMSSIRQQTPLSTLSVDSASYNIEEQMHETSTTCILTFRHGVDILNPFKRYSTTTVHVTDEKLKHCDLSTSNSNVKHFMKKVLSWKRIINREEERK